MSKKNPSWNLQASGIFILASAFAFTLGEKIMSFVGFAVAVGFSLAYMMIDRR